MPAAKRYLYPTVWPSRVAAPVAARSAHHTARVSGTATWERHWQPSGECNSRYNCVAKAPRACRGPSPTKPAAANVNEHAWVARWFPMGSCTSVPAAATQQAWCTPIPLAKACAPACPIGRPQHTANAATSTGDHAIMPTSCRRTRSGRPKLHDWATTKPLSCRRPCQAQIAQTHHQQQHSRPHGRPQVAAAHALQKQLCGTITTDISTLQEPAPLAELRREHSQLVAAAAARPVVTRRRARRLTRLALRAGARVNSRASRLRECV
jgi:hypothetical protein